MPYADPQGKRDALKRWKRANREKVAAQKRRHRQREVERYRAENPQATGSCTPAEKARKRAYYAANRERIQERIRQRKAEYREWVNLQKGGICRGCVQPFAPEELSY